MKMLRKTGAVLVLVMFVLACVVCVGCGGKNGNEGDGGEVDGKAGGEGEPVKEATATTMRLEKTEGVVEVTDETGKEQETREKLPLFSGYGIRTRELSFGWFNLDDVKLAKLDEESAASIEKEGKHLKVLVEDGGLYFHVTEPLEEDESMEIRISSMAVGIRGTSGWVDSETDTLYLIEGRVICEDLETEETVEVTAGQYARVRKEVGGFETGVFQREDIPAYVGEEVDDERMDRLEEILQDAGSMTATLPLTFDELSSMAQSAYEAGVPLVITAGDTENVLTYDGFGTIEGNLVIDRGVDVLITTEGGMLVAGTVEVRGNVENAGQILIDEGGSVHVKGAFYNSGRLENGWMERSYGQYGMLVRQNSWVIAENGIVNDGTISNQGGIQGELTIDGGSLVLNKDSEVEQVVLNAGMLVEDGGSYESLVQNGGEVRSGESLRNEANQQNGVSW